MFRNDPRDVAAAFHERLGTGGALAGAFERVVFAVPDRAPDAIDRVAFGERFGV
ncbi:hypothetical protein [Embleya sp. NPDC059259]|uniref:hypothetical protein n=1 Tax=unclassified Embleya TaxID=2699296 RepID=UPI003698F5F7